MLVNKDNPLDNEFIPSNLVEVLSKYKKSYSQLQLEELLLTGQTENHQALYELVNYFVERLLLIWAFFLVVKLIKILFEISL